MSNVYVGQVYKDSKHNAAIGSKRRLKVTAVNFYDEKATVIITKDKTGKNSSIMKQVSLDRFNGRSRGYTLVK